MPIQVPGYYRHAVGDIMVTALNDGMLEAGPEVLLGIGGEEAAALLTEAFLPPSPAITLNAFVVQTAGRTILIDAGAGATMGPSVGRLMANLHHAGHAPGDVAMILITHMHPDHIGGLLDANGAAAFSKARLIVPQEDFAFFLDPAIAEKVPAEAQHVFAGARAVAAAYAGRLEPFEGTEEVAPGIAPVPLPGHSPGHTGYRITSGSDTLLIWGDVVHVPGLQFRRPDVGMVFDADASLAQQTRREIFAVSAAQRQMVSGMHMPFPPFAHIAADGDSFHFVPLLWNPTTSPLDAR